MLSNATAHPTLLPAIIAAGAGLIAAILSAYVLWKGQKRANQLVADNLLLQRQAFDQTALLRDIRDAIREQAEAQRQDFEQFIRDMFALNYQRRQSRHSDDG